MDSRLLAYVTQFLKTCKHVFGTQMVKLSHSND